jgi:hypothetical protein
MKISFAQVGIGTTNPDSSALLELDSNNSGLLIPRVTEAERNSITDPANGLLIYQTNVIQGLYCYDEILNCWKLVSNDLDFDPTNEIELPMTPQIGAMTYWDGTNWVVVEPTINEGATLKMIEGVPSWEGGTPPPKIGDLIAGGIIFYIAPEPTDLDGNGTLDKGLVCALSDQSNGTQWIIGGNTQTEYNGNTLTEIGTGKANTIAMMSQSGYIGGAAKVCNDYENPDTGTGIYDDWFLPSIAELNEMFSQTTILNTVTGFTPANGFIYWSSSEMVNINAYAYVFFGSTIVSKSSNGFVRPIRAF